MKPLMFLGMLALSAAAAAGGAQPLTSAEPSGAGGGSEIAATAPAGTDAPASAAASGVGPHPAETVDWDAQLYHSRPLVIFADSPENPDFVRQLQLIERDLPALEERRVVVVVDTDPAAHGDWRRRLRPNGFSLVLLDTDLRPVFRKPSPWDVREISRTIDRLPSRRQDLSRQFPSGR